MYPVMSFGSNCYHSSAPRFVQTSSPICSVCLVVTILAVRHTRWAKHSHARRGRTLSSPATARTRPRKATTSEDAPRTLNCGGQIRRCFSFAKFLDFVHLARPLLTRNRSCAPESWDCMAHGGRRHAPLSSPLDRNRSLGRRPPCVRTPQGRP